MRNFKAYNRKKGFCGRLVRESFSEEKKLEKSGFIKIVRGAEGGCRLIVDLHTMSLYDLMEALGADRLVNACMQPEYRCTWQERHAEICSLHCRLGEVQKKMDALLRDCSLYELLYGQE